MLVLFLQLVDFLFHRVVFVEQHHEVLFVFDVQFFLPLQLVLEASDDLLVEVVVILSVHASELGHFLLQLLILVGFIVVFHLNFLELLIELLFLLAQLVDFFLELPSAA